MKRRIIWSGYSSVATPDRARTNNGAAVLAAPCRAYLFLYPLLLTFERSAHRGTDHFVATVGPSGVPAAANPNVPAFA